MSRGGTPHWLQPCTWLRSRLRCSALERPAFERMASASARSKKSNCCKSPPVIGSVRAQCCSCSALFSSMLPSRLATSSDVRPRPLPAASPSGRSSGSSPIALSCGARALPMMGRTKRPAACCSSRDRQTMESYSRGTGHKGA
eukprot:scaffold106613_cov61-Phaeocystis_antarctica.AAC.3